MNRAKDRTLYFENFHLKNGTADYITTRRTYTKEFQDLGVAYEATRKIKYGEIQNFIIIYKVDPKLKKNRYVLYYQEKSGTLRKIKLKVTDLSEIGPTKKLALGDELTLGIKKL